MLDEREYLKEQTVEATRTALTELRDERLDYYLAFSVSAYADTRYGSRKLEFRAVTMDGTTRRMVSHHLGTTEDACLHEACAVVDLANRAIDWAQERASEDALREQGPRQLPLWPSEGTV